MGLFDNFKRDKEERNQEEGAEKNKEQAAPQKDSTIIYGRSQLDGAHIAGNQATHTNSTTNHDTTIGTTGQFVREQQTTYVAPSAQQTTLSNIGAHSKPVQDLPQVPQTVQTPQDAENRNNIKPETQPGTMAAGQSTSSSLQSQAAPGISHAVPVQKQSVQPAVQQQGVPTTPTAGTPHTRLEGRLQQPVPQQREVPVSEPRQTSAGISVSQVQQGQNPREQKITDQSKTVAPVQFRQEQQRTVSHGSTTASLQGSPSSSKPAPPTAHDERYTTQKVNHVPSSAAIPEKATASPKETVVSPKVPIDSPGASMQNREVPKQPQQASPTSQQKAAEASIEEVLNAVISEQSHNNAAASVAPQKQPVPSQRQGEIEPKETNDVPASVPAVEKAPLIAAAAPSPASAAPISPAVSSVSGEEPPLTGQASHTEVAEKREANSERVVPEEQSEKPSLIKSTPIKTLADKKPISHTIETTEIIAVINQKGGVGKTTTAINLSAALGMQGKAVLLIDLDPQGNTTSGLGVDKGQVTYDSYNLLLDGVPIEEAIIPDVCTGLDLVPATINLAGAEVELVNEMARENRLKGALANLRGKYDYIFIDCPPALGLLTVNALVASDGLLIPIQCEFYALEGVTKLLDSMKRVKSMLNPGLDTFGVLLTMYDGRTMLARQVAEEVHNFFGAKVFETVVPRTVRLSEAPSFGQPITEYDPSGKGAKAYMALAKEVIQRAKD